MPKNNRPTVEEIKEWLHDHGTLEAFITNYEKRELRDPLDEHIKNEGLYIMMHSFVFTKTPEGPEYWFRMYAKYSNWYLNFNLR